VGGNRSSDGNRQYDVPPPGAHALAEAWVSQTQPDADVREEQEERSGRGGEGGHPTSDRSGGAQRGDYSERVEQRYGSGGEAKDDVSVDCS
jgi:hypothetical protein